jgi:N-acetylglucosaminyldiphosphoundecaprenol N-acetyl-beta-D-mannosaminyltransferase
VSIPEFSLNGGPDKINFLGVRIDRLTLDMLLDYIIHSVQSQEKSIIAYANVHALNLSLELPWFRDFLNQSALTYCDGFGVKWGARLLGYSLPQRFTPPDWFPQLAEICAQNGLSFFFLGARPGIADKCSENLQRQFPKIKIIGTHHGFFDKTPSCEANEDVIKLINSAQPDILVVGFGMPAQERWLLENWERINAHVALPVGAMFDYLAGEVLRAPHWMTEHGLEWLGRLAVEPRRLWKRYVIGNPRFFWLVIQQRLGLFKLK